MKLQLAKTLDGIGQFGSIYDLETCTADTVEEYVIDDKDDWFLENMVDRINAACGTLLDYGDYDYIAADKCRDLIKTIDDLPDDFVPVDHEQLMLTLREYAARAIQYNTGLSIEM